MRALPLASATLPALLLALTPASGFSQTVDEAGALALELQIPAALDVLFQGAPDVSYRFDGVIEAVPDGDSYAVSFPSFVVSSGRDVQVTVAPGQMDVTPLDNGWQKAEWDLPSPIALSDPGNDTFHAEFRFESTGSSVTVAPEYGMVLDADISFDAVEFVSDEEEGSIVAEEIALRVETEPSGLGPDTFDSGTDFSVNSVSVDIPDTDVFMEVGSINLAAETERQRFDLFGGIQERLEGIDPESEEFVSAIIALLREGRDEKWIGNTEFGMTVEDVSYSFEGMQGAFNAFELSLAAIDLDAATSELFFGVTLDGSSNNAVPPEMAEVALSDFAFKLRALEAPIEALAAVFYDVLGEPVSQGDAFGPKGRRAGVTDSDMEALAQFDPTSLLPVLLASDVDLVLERFFVEAPIGYIEGSGVVSPDPQSAFQTVAEFSFAFAGLPEITAFAQNLGGQAAQAASLAPIFVAMGRDETDDDGTPIKVFDVEVTAAGQILLNGNDMSAMVGLFQ